jgi:hypothetical protein
MKKNKNEMVNLVGLPGKLKTCEIKTVKKSI